MLKHLIHVPYCGPATYADIFIELSIFMSDSDPFLSYMLGKQKKKKIQANESDT